MKTCNIVKDNLDNYYQRKDAAEAVANQIIEQAYGGSLYNFWIQAENAYDFIPRNLDARRKEVKAFNEAQRKLLEAIHEYDLARSKLNKSC